MRRPSLNVLIVCWAAATLAPAAAFPEPRPFPAAAEAPPGIRESLLNSCRQVVAAATLDAIAAARAHLDRLSERQREADRTWLVTADDVAFAVGTLRNTGRYSSAGVAVPLDHVLSRLHWRLAAAASLALDKASGGSVTTTPGGVVAAARLAAGDRAAERGWPTAAIAAWRDAETIAQWMQDPARASQAADRLAAVAALQTPTAPIEFSEDPASPPVAGELLWQHRLPPDERRQNTSGAAAVALALSAAGSSETGPLVCWHTSGGIHARRLSDGGVPWRDAAAEPLSDRLFPPAGDTPVSAPLWPPCLSAGRLLSVITPQAGRAGPVSGGVRLPLLVCLDVTDATEGRLEWSTPLPVSVADGAGQPVCGPGDRGEACAFLCLRGVTDELVALRLADGHLLWRRPLNLGRSHAGEPSPSLPTLTLAEDLLLVASPDGCVWAVDLAGDLVWVQKQATEPASARPETESREASLPPVTLSELGDAITRSNAPADSLECVTGHSRLVVCDGNSIRVFALLETD